MTSYNTREEAIGDSGGRQGSTAWVDTECFVNGASNGLGLKWMDDGHI